MRNTRCLAVGLAMLTIVPAAFAQFVGPAPIAWRWQQSTAAAPAGSPIVVGDVVYVAVGGRMYAIERETGNQLWRFPAGEPIPGNFRNGMTIADGVAVAVSDGNLVYGVDAKTGAAKWTANSPSGILGTPVSVGKSVVYAQGDNTLMGYNSDGTPLWSEGPLKVQDGLYRNLVAMGDTVVFFSPVGSIEAVRVTTRKLAWKVPMDSVSPSSVITPFGDNLYVNSGNYLVCINGVKGTGKWQVPFSENLMLGPAVGPDGIAVVNIDGKVYFTDLNGRRVTKTPIDLGSLPSCAPSVVGTNFMFPTTNGGLQLLDPKTGVVLWNYIIPSLVTTSSSAPAGGGLGGGGLGGGALGGGGAQTSTTPAKRYNPEVAGPVVNVGNTLLALIRDGSLIAFDRNLGVDRTGPSVKMVWPIPGSQISGQPPLQFMFELLDDTSGINESTFEVKVDGVLMEKELKRDGTATVNFSTFGKNKPMSDGRKEVVVTVRDWMGNETVAKYVLLIDNSLPALRPKTDQNGVGGGGLGGGKRGGIGGG